MLMLQTEVAFCVVVGDAFYDLFEGCVNVGILTVFYPIADEVAHNAAEVVMADRKSVV